MKPISNCFLRAAAAFCLACGFATLAPAQNLTLRIATYNIEDDINGATTPLPGLINPSAGGPTTSGGVLEGIGEEVLSDGVAQPIDILALQETTSNPTTIAPIVAGLNAFYGQYNPLAANMYAMSSYQATEEGGDTADGNGPNAIVYNTKTVQLLASVPVDPVGGTGALGSSSGEYREVMRYEFAPAGQTPTAATEFYIYVSHYKSGTSSADLTDRGGEAVVIRTNEAASLPSNARVIYSGDFNVTTSSEASYQTIVVANSPNGVAQGQGVDPLNTAGTTGINWGTSTLLNMKTESATDLRYRDDFLVGTTNVYSGVAGGLALVVGTYHTFGNNGTTAYQGSVNSGSDTALNTDLAPGSPISASTLYKDLSTGSDHLPVVADYTIPVVQPGAAFTSSPSAPSALPPLSVTFTDASTGIVTNWFWNYGDGTTTNTTNTLSVTHSYTTAGVYTVSETVTGPGGMNTLTKTGLVTVLTPYQSWQLQYFGCDSCPQAATTYDDDGTGQDNLFKYVAGLNPTNPASIFVFTTASVPGNPTEKNLNFSPVVAGRTYTAVYSTAINGPWMPLTTFTTNVNGSQETITDTGATQTQKYYSIEISGP